MTLVTYSDSEGDDDSDQTRKEVPNNDTHLGFTNGHKRKRSRDEEQPLPTSKPPPLPSNLASLYASNARSSTDDNPALHQGRRRQIPHVEGNWPSFVYLEWLPAPSDLSHLENLIATVANEHNSNDTATSASQEKRQQVRSSLRSDLGVLQPLHVSLSTPLILTTDNKDSFESTLTRNIRELNQGAFTTSPSGLRWVSNFDGTRSFLIITLKTPANNDLQTLLSICNRTAASFRLPELYSSSSNDSVQVGVMPGTAPTECEDTDNGPLMDGVSSSGSKFHISIAWSLEKVQTSQMTMEHLQSKLKDLQITFDRVYIKIGNQVSAVRLYDQIDGEGKV